MSECKMTFLYEASKILPKNNCGTFIRSQLVAKLFTEGHFHLPAQNFKPSVMCRACGVQMAECPPKTRIEAPPKKTRLIRRIIRMLQENRPLSRYQRDVLQTFKKKDFQKMTRTCKMCGDKVVTNIEKPDFKAKDPKKMPWKEQVSNKAKRKRRDVFSGLNSAAVLATQQARTRNVESPITVLKDKNDAHNIHLVNQSIPLPKPRNEKPNKGKGKKKSKFQHNKIEKNEVLKKTEKNLTKNVQRMQNLANMLQGTQGNSGSLATFLKNI